MGEVRKPRCDPLDGGQRLRRRHLHPAAHEDVVDAVREPVSRVQREREREAPSS